MALRSPRPSQLRGALTRRICVCGAAARWPSLSGYAAASGVPAAQPQARPTPQRTLWVLRTVLRHGLVGGRLRRAALAAVVRSPGGVSLEAAAALAIPRWRADAGACVDTPAMSCETRIWLQRCAAEGPPARPPRAAAPRARKVGAIHRGAQGAVDVAQAPQRHARAEPVLDLCKRPLRHPSPRRRPPRRTRGKKCWRRSRFASCGR